MADQDFKPKFLRIPEFCRETGVCKTKVYGLIKEGRIAAASIGASLRIPYSELERLEREALGGK